MSAADLLQRMEERDVVLLRLKPSREQNHRWIALADNLPLVDGGSGGETFYRDGVGDDAAPLADLRRPLGQRIRDRLAGTGDGRVLPVHPAVESTQPAEPAAPVVGVRLKGNEGRLSRQRLSCQGHPKLGREEEAMRQIELPHGWPEPQQMTRRIKSRPAGCNQRHT